MIPKLEVSHLCYSYHTMEGETEALFDLSFQVQTGEFLAVVGPSGCGKSTLLSLICGLLKPDSGRILLDGQPVLEGDTRIGYMLQKDHLFEWRTIRSNACLGLEIQKKMDPDHEKKVEELLKAYGLGNFAEARPSELSGGMRQRAAFARTLLTGSELLLLDEPFSALDFLTRITMQEWLLDQWEQDSKTVLFITHDVEEAIFLSGRVLVVEDTPIRKLHSFEVPAPYPRTRACLTDPKMLELRENLISLLRKEVQA